MIPQWNLELPGPKNPWVSLNGGVKCMNGGMGFVDMPTVILNTYWGYSIYLLLLVGGLNPSEKY